MTPYSLLSEFAGLSHREAAEFHRVRLDTVKSWSAGRNRAPNGALAELRNLIAWQDRAARQTLDQIGALAPTDAPNAVEISFPADDDEARALGWPCVGAWRAMAARVLAQSPHEIRYVARGTTRVTAAVAETRERQ